MVKSKVYIASRYALRNKAANVAQRLRDTGQFVIVSTWHDGAKDWEGAPTEEEVKTIAQKDYDEVFDADILLALSDQPGALFPYGSHHIEFGLAYAWEKQCVVVGPLELMFHRLSGVLHYENLNEFLEATTNDEPYAYGQ